MKILLDNQEVDVEIIRKDNKNLYIRIKEDLKIYVTCNKHISTSEIEKILQKNYKSLLKMYNLQKKIHDEKNFYYYLGDKYTIIYDEGIKKTQIDGDFILVKDDKMLTKFYQTECERIFNDRVNKIAPLFSYLPNYKIRIRKMSTRWGVCNRGNNVVTLNSELLKKDITLLDYVIVHEFCHFKEANHSSKFWAEVSKYYPYYKEARKMLKN